MLHVTGNHLPHRSYFLHPQVYFFGLLLLAIGRSSAGGDGPGELCPAARWERRYRGCTSELPLDPTIHCQPAPPHPF
jgi:hypothetical protein